VISRRKLARTVIGQSRLWEPGGKRGGEKGLVMKEDDRNLLVTKRVKAETKQSHGVTIRGGS